MKIAKWMIAVNALLFTVFGLYFFLLPPALAWYHLQDDAFEQKSTPSVAMKYHAHLTPKFEVWATERLQSNLVAETNLTNVSGNEWPLFSAFFYLLSTEALQTSFELNNEGSIAPKVYSKKSLDLAARLLTNKKHATWVKRQWGDDYLRKENVFYRALQIGGLTAHYELTQNPRYLEYLREQTNSLALELDSSAHGLLHDFPDECYPADVLLAFASIKRADKVLGTDHSTTVERAKRGFLNYTDSYTGLPPFTTSIAEIEKGNTLGFARGSSTALLLQFAPELWQDISADWAQKMEKHFWQENWQAVGFGEYPKGLPNSAEYQWFFDIDAGPVLAGHGFTASAFGAGAMRKNGKFNLAYPLFGEMLLLAYPLLNGDMLTPKLLSDVAHAPLIGEIGILYNLSTMPVVPQSEWQKSNGEQSTFYWIVSGILWLIGLFIIWRGIRRARRGREMENAPPYIALQFLFWLSALMITFYFAFDSHWSWAVGLLLISRLFPVLEKESK